MLHSQGSNISLELRTERDISRRVRTRGVQIRLPAVHTRSVSVTLTFWFSQGCDTARHATDERAVPSLSAGYTSASRAPPPASWARLWVCVLRVRSMLHSIYHALTGNVTPMGVRTHPYDLEGKIRWEYYYYLPALFPLLLSTLSEESRPRPPPVPKGYSRPSIGH